MFSDERVEIEKELIKRGYTWYKFIESYGFDYFYEVDTAWRGKHIIRVTQGLFGLAIEPQLNY